ncbi:MAG: hypothetical protein ACE10D_04470 [Planctomycetota bacterium]
MLYDYRPEVLEQLAKHGIRPKSSTRPQAVMDHLRDVYCFELRQLRARLLGEKILKADYAGHVVALRKQYMLISIPTRLWTKENV